MGVATWSPSRNLPKFIVILFAKTKRKCVPTLGVGSPSFVFSRFHLWKQKFPTLKRWEDLRVTSGRRLSELRLDFERTRKLREDVKKTVFFPKTICKMEKKEMHNAFFLVFPLVLEQKSVAQIRYGRWLLLFIDECHTWVMPHLPSRIPHTLLRVLRRDR